MSVHKVAINLSLDGLSIHWWLLPRPIISFGVLVTFKNYFVPFISWDSSSSRIWLTKGNNGIAKCSGPSEGPIFPALFHIEKGQLTLLTLWWSGLNSNLIPTEGTLCAQIMLKSASIQGDGFTLPRKRGLWELQGAFSQHTGSSRTFKTRGLTTTDWPCWFGEGSF